MGGGTTLPIIYHPTAAANIVKKFLKKRFSTNSSGKAALIWN